MNSELLKHILEIPQTLALTWVLMGIRVPILFQSRFSNEDHSGVLYTTKPFKKKGFGRHGFSSVVARPGFEPGLFSSKGRRVASYTIGQLNNELFQNGAQR
jgi:hypothetical protein